MNNFVGCNDDSAKEDLLGIEKYAKGFAKYLCEVKTPMTFAIQGDWGQGKTSFLNLVETSLVNDQKIEKKNLIWFKAWEYVQFSNANNLSISLIQRLIYDFGAQEKLLNMVGKIALSSIGLISKVALHGGIEIKANELINYIGKDDAKIYDDLKKNLKAAVNDKLGIKNDEEKREENREDSSKDRIIVFVDDLDRLEPIKAIEIMETIKNFLWFEHLVFVLAIDVDVVKKGVEQKYKGMLDDEKGVKFFEKIIQVPFTIPSEKYNMKNYIKEKLNEQKLKIQDGNIDIYINLALHSVGRNPRSFNRLLNQFQLYTYMESDSANKNKEILFMVICAQNSYKELYKSLQLSAMENKESFKIDNFNEIVKEFENTESNESLMLFIKDMKDIINANENNIEILGKMLTESNLTNVESSSRNKIFDDFENRWRNKINSNGIIGEINKCIESEFSIEKAFRWSSDKYLNECYLVHKIKKKFGYATEIELKVVFKKEKDIINESKIGFKIYCFAGDGIYKEEKDIDSDKKLFKEMFEKLKLPEFEKVLNDKTVRFNSDIRFRIDDDDESIVKCIKNNLIPIIEHIEKFNN